MAVHLVVYSVLPLLATVCIFSIFAMFSTGKKWDPKGKNCYVTGGSQGTGLALAILLAKKGANVTIIARTQSKLKIAVEELERHRQTPDQVFRWHSFALESASSSEAALEAECNANDGFAPDAFFLCAGTSKPYFWLENSEEDLVKGMEQAYWVQAWSAHAASKKLVQQGRTGKIVFVGSTLSLMSFVGYTSYSPGKHALKGLAETLRSELLLYGITVHIYFAPTINSPGYAVEMTTKPAITKSIEEDDAVLSTERAASGLLQGVESGQFHISGSILTKIFRASSRGSSPSSNVLIDTILDNVAWIVVPIWRRLTDSRIVAHSQEHRAYLASRGLFAEASRK